MSFFSPAYQNWLAIPWALAGGYNFDSSVAAQVKNLAMRCIFYERVISSQIRALIASQSAGIEKEML